MPSSGKAIVAVGLFAILLLTAAVAAIHSPAESKALAANRTDEVRPTALVSTEQPRNEASQMPLLFRAQAGEVSASKTAAAYEIPWQSVNAGGDDMSSTNYQMSSSAGQSCIGYTSGGSYSMGTGYWYGVETITSENNCGSPFGDVNCDAAVNPVDVVYMVNYVYKNQDARCYPGGWNCPYDIGDVDCNGAVNPIDVVYYVNYVYKNQDAFCSP
jgi:hypothetical protein